MSDERFGVILRAQQQRHELRRQLEAAEPYLVERGLEHVHEGDDRLQAEESGGALDGVRAAEDEVDGLGGGAAARALEETRLHFAQQLLALGDEGRERIGDVHDAAPPAAAGGSSPQRHSSSTERTTGLTATIDRARRRAAAVRRATRSSCRPVVSISVTPARSSLSGGSDSSSSGRSCASSACAPWMFTAPASCRQSPLRVSSNSRSMAMGAQAVAGISLLTAAISTLGWNGLVIQALAPAARPSSFLSCPASVVSMMIGMNLCLALALICLSSVMPSISGMFTSLITRLTRSASSCFSASTPLPASTTS